MANNAKQLVRAPVSLPWTLDGQHIRGRPEPREHLWGSVKRADSVIVASIMDDTTGLYTFYGPADARAHRAYIVRACNNFQQAVTFVSLACEELKICGDAGHHVAAALAKAGRALLAEVTP